MNSKELENNFTDFAKANKFKVDKSRFEGEAYVMAKPGTIYLKFGDVRIGRRAGIALNLKSGGIHMMTSYMPYGELLSYMQGLNRNIKKDIAQIKRDYKIN